jgi:hypothetical protein
MPSARPHAWFAARRESTKAFLDFGLICAHRRARSGLTSLIHNRLKRALRNSAASPMVMISRIEVLIHSS